MATSKVILIDNSTHEVIVFSSKAMLSRFIGVPYDTCMSWFRHGVKKVKKNEYIIYSVDKFIDKAYMKLVNDKGKV